MRFLVPGEPCGRSPRTRPPLTYKPPVEAAAGWEPLAADQFRTAALCPPPNPPRSSLFKSPVGAVQVAADSPGKPSRQAISVRRAGCSLREQTRAAVLARSFPLQANRTAGPPRTKVSHSPRGPWGQIWRLTPHVGLLCQASIPPSLVRRTVCKRRAQCAERPAAMWLRGPGYRSLPGGRPAVRRCLRHETWRQQNSSRRAGCNGHCRRLPLGRLSEAAGNGPGCHLGAMSPRGIRR